MKNSILLLLVTLCAGCGTLPNVDYLYYPAKSSTLVSLERTVACDKLGNIVEANTPLLKTRYSADSSHEPKKISLAKLRGIFHDSEVGVQWFEDGRLKSINQTSSGRGEQIIGTVAKIAATPIGGAAIAPGTKQYTPCEFIAAVGEDKPVTISYKPMGDVDPASKDFVAWAWFAPATEHDRALHDRLAARLTSIYVKFKEALDNPTRIAYKEKGSDDDLSLNETRTAVYEFYSADRISPSMPANAKHFFTASTVVTGGKRYFVPIPPPAPFGKQVFSLELNEAGAVLSSKYGSESGASSVLGAINAIGSAAGARTSAAAAEIEAEADLIAQQQRLVRCRATPATCT